MNPLRAPTLTLAVLLPACALPGPDDVSNTVDDVSNSVDEEAIAEELEAHLVDTLVCSEKVRPSTVERLRAVLRDPSQQTLTDLATSPDVVAEVVAVAGTRVEASVILLNNLALLYEQGHAGIVLEEGWDTLSCDDEITLACTAGSGTTAARCDTGTSPDTVELSFESCVLGGTMYDGSARLSRLADDATRHGLAFDGLTFDEVDRLDGELLLDVDAAAGTRSLSLGDGTSLALVSHGGPEGAPCGETLSFDAFRAAHAASDATLALDALRQTADETYGLRTLGEHLRFEAPYDCACPTAGSSLEVEFPRPLSDEGETATLRVTYGASSSEAQCASVEVSILDWPQECPLLDQAQADCGQEAARRAVESLLQAFCAPMVD